jgi:hypothetical protein
MGGEGLNMADIRLDFLPAIANPSLTHIVPAMGGEVAGRLTLAQILASFHVGTVKTAPADNDEFAWSDSAAAFEIKRMSFANLKSALKAIPFVPVGGPAPSDPDLNTYISGGFQGRIQLTTTSIPNAPPVTGLFYVLVFETSATRTSQILVPYTNANQGVWFRTQTSAWSAWERFARMSEVLALAGGIMTGPLVLSGDPSAALHAATKQYIDKHQGGLKAWVNFNGTGTVAIRDSYNVSSITDNGTGAYTINFASPMANANYGMIACAGHSSGGGYVRLRDGTTPSTNSIAIDTLQFNGGGLIDHSYIFAAFFGD